VIQSFNCHCRSVNSTSYLVDQVNAGLYVVSCIAMHIRGCYLNIWQRNSDVIFINQLNNDFRAEYRKQNCCLYMYQTSFIAAADRKWRRCCFCSMSSLIHFSKRKTLFRLSLLNACPSLPLYSIIPLRHIFRSLCISFFHSTSQPFVHPYPLCSFLPFSQPSPEFITQLHIPAPFSFSVFLCFFPTKYAK